MNLHILLSLQKLLSYLWVIYLVQRYGFYFKFAIAALKIFQQFNVFFN
nr:MAG TPA: hypothetical protein [Crassvirales sp.]DAP80945.1 MAG TPA: hypothetical protein [Crassvirales sp.]